MKRQCQLTFLDCHNFPFHQSIVEGSVDAQNALLHVADVVDFVVKVGLELILVLLHQGLECFWVILHSQGLRHAVS